MDTTVKKGILLEMIAAAFWEISGTLGQYLFQQRGINVEWLITVRMLVSGIGLLYIATKIIACKI